MALEDVFLLSNLLTHNSQNLEDLLQVYERKRKARTEKVLKAAERNGDVRKKTTPLRLWVYELAISWGLWISEMVGLDKLGMGKQLLAYDVEEEQFE